MLKLEIAKIGFIKSSCYVESMWRRYKPTGVSVGISLAIFHGPRQLAKYDNQGHQQKELYKAVA
ncbi:MAG: hypothetical protein D0528_11235 [Methylococcales bacterium]|nr:MAG: hypothetical protein D0528_11235 [Methylococcales bacterium]